MVAQCPLVRSGRGGWSGWRGGSSLGGSGAAVAWVAVYCLRAVRSGRPSEGPAARRRESPAVLNATFSPPTPRRLLRFPGSQPRGLPAAEWRPASAGCGHQAPRRALGQKQGHPQGSGAREEEEEAQEAVPDAVALSPAPRVRQVPVPVPLEGQALPAQRLPDRAALPVGVRARCPGAGLLGWFPVFTYLCTS